MQIHRTARFGRLRPDRRQVGLAAALAVTAVAVMTVGRCSF
jgi:hypothetical protein